MPGNSLKDVNNVLIWNKNNKGDIKKPYSEISIFKKFWQVFLFFYFSVWVLVLMPKDDAIVYTYLRIDTTLSLDCGVDWVVFLVYPDVV